MSVNSPIPQMINISNTLSANTIQQIRSDLSKWQTIIHHQRVAGSDSKSTPLLLTINDYERILSHLNSLIYAKRQFILDNLLINDPQDSNYKSVTDADRNLYNGLLNMYKDYIIELEQLKVTFNYQNNTQQQPIEPVQQQQQQQQVKPSERIIDHINKVLPTELAKVRKEFIDKLIKDSELRESLKPTHDFNPNEDLLLSGIIKLCNLDINNKDNIIAYLKFLKLLGYSKELLRERLPSALTKPKPRPKQKIKQPQVSTSVTKSIKNPSAPSSSPSSSTPATVKTKQTKKKISKPDIYIADSTNKNAVVNITDNNSDSNNNDINDNQTVSDSNKITRDNEINDYDSTTAEKINIGTDIGINKKKISFSKYLQKDENDKEQQHASLKRSISGDNNVIQEDHSIAKKRKITIPSNDIITSSNTIEAKSPTLKSNSSIKLTSILKSFSTDNNDTPERRLKNKNSKLRFMDDKDLVTVYGDDLPQEGLKVTPNDLKKILRPFIEGEPSEKLYLDTVNTSLSSMGQSIQVVPLNLNNVKSGIENNDIVETRGGPIKCDTMAPLLYRNEFCNFSKDLKKFIPKEPIITNEDIEALNNPELNKPIIARPFGKNKLLLRNDRGGLPYKPVPEVTKNYYPIRYSSYKK